MSRLSDVFDYARADSSTLLNEARRVVDYELEHCNLFRSKLAVALPKLAADDLVLGRILGRGTFCVVREIKNVKPTTLQVSPSKLHTSKRGSEKKVSHSESSGSDPKVLKSKSKKSSHASVGTRDGASAKEARNQLICQIQSKEGPSYVVKYVDPEHSHTSKDTFLKGIIGLSLETHILASLQHPHILKIVGVSKHNPFKNAGYFCIFEQLQEILTERLGKWMHTYRASQGVTGFFTRGGRTAKKLLLERLLVAYQVANAMSYLHERKIIYRDIKPDNVGFDKDDTLKLFDFGLAKELRKEELTENGLYRMTGFTGAVRYMAPEVGLTEPYNLKADVYSWSMLMWYIMALVPPLCEYTPNTHIQNVFMLGDRPPIFNDWPENLSKLMKDCWSANIMARPDFNHIMKILKQEMCAMISTAAFSSCDENPSMQISDELGLLFLSSSTK